MFDNPDFSNKRPNLDPDDPHDHTKTERVPYNYSNNDIFVSASGPAHLCQVPSTLNLKQLARIIDITLYN